MVTVSPGSIETSGGEKLSDTMLTPAGTISGAGLATVVITVTLLFAVAVSLESVDTREILVSEPAEVGAKVLRVFERRVNRQSAGHVPGADRPVLAGTDDAPAVRREHGGPDAEVVPRRRWGIAADASATLP